jgi:excisionase family DNA binding protein
MKATSVSQLELSDVTAAEVRAPKTRAFGGGDDAQQTIVRSERDHRSFQSMQPPSKRAKHVVAKTCDPNSIEALLSFAEAARTLGISLRQFRRLVDAGKIAFVKVSERTRGCGRASCNDSSKRPRSTQRCNHDRICFPTLADRKWKASFRAYSADAIPAEIAREFAAGPLPSSSILFTFIAKLALGPELAPGDAIQLTPLAFAHRPARWRSHRTRDVRLAGRECHRRARNVVTPAARPFRLECDAAYAATFGRSSEFSKSRTSARIGSSRIG